MSDTGWYENEVGELLKLAQNAPNPAWRQTLRKYINPAYQQVNELF